MRTLIASTLLLSASAFAHDTNFSTESCEASLNAGLNINKKHIEFVKNDKVLYRIEQDQYLVINGEQVALSSQQQRLVSEYSTEIRELIPQVKDVAVEAVELATEGINLAFNQLLGNGNSISTDLTHELNIIKDEVNDKFEYGEFSIDEHGNLQSDFFGEEFDQRVEEAVENIVQKSLGSLLIALGQQMVFSGGDMDALEARMEKFGEQIETEMEQRSHELELKAEGLCDNIYHIDNLEEQLKSSITNFPQTNVIESKDTNPNKA